jgi:RimJ/RimL family protein N-acetyltransferase
MCVTNRDSERVPGKVSLRPAEAGDLPTFFQQETHPEANRMAVVNPRDIEGFRSARERNMTNPGIVARVIIVEGVVVGSISCFDWDGVRSVGDRIAREHWGKGIATRALAMLLEVVSLRPLHARVASSNVASIRVLEKCGFRVTGHEWAPATDRFPACEEAILVLS